MTNLQIPEDQQEDEGDLAGTVRFRDAVVVNSDWTIETINLQIEKGNIDLQPAFQRRAAWDEVRKSRLIESIIVGMPVPNIVLAENHDHRGRFIVIDGKQRLVAISQFIRGEYALKGLDIRSELNGKTYGNLPEGDRNNFDNSTLRSTVIKNWQDQDFLYAIFYRLNSGSLPLSPQELRKALTGGKLIDHIEEYLLGSSSFQALFGEVLDKRMRDSELVLRFIAFEKFLPHYDGNFKRFLDNTTSHFEENWPSRRDEVNQILEALDRSLICARDVFGPDVFKKWVGDRYERVMNRAVFDCIARFFSSPEVAAEATRRRVDVETSFQNLCLDGTFRTAIEQTTKSRVATFTRIQLWGGALAGAIGRSFDATELRVG
jgi:hypothetical protein